MTCNFRRYLKCLLAALVLAAFAVPSQATMVRLLTSVGPIDIALYDESAPLTVANFLAYVNRGAYSNSLIHRSVPGFIIQGGGFAWPSTAVSPIAIPANAAVRNEFSTSRSNARGTVAMAKLGSDPNSATNQWFVNLANNNDPTNPLNLDAQNGGFTVFGKVTTSGMKIADNISTLRIVNAGGSPYDNLPIVSLPASGTLRAENLVLVKSASVIPPSATATESDRIFNYLEASYPQYLSLPGSTSTTGLGYYFRYYEVAKGYGNY